MRRNVSLAESASLTGIPAADNGRRYGNTIQECAWRPHVAVHIVAWGRDSCRRYAGIDGTGGERHSGCLSTDGWFILCSVSGLITAKPNAFKLTQALVELSPHALVARLGEPHPAALLRGLGDDASQAPPSVGRAGVALP